MVASRPCPRCIPRGFVYSQRQALMSMDLLNKVATTALLGFVVLSMMAMGVGFTVRQIVYALGDVRLIFLALLAKFCSDAARRARFGQSLSGAAARGGSVRCVTAAEIDVFGHITPPASLDAGDCSAPQHRVDGNLGKLPDGCVAALPLR